MMKSALVANIVSPTSIFEFGTFRGETCHLFLENASDEVKFIPVTSHLLATGIKILKTTISLMLLKMINFLLNLGII